MAKSKRYNSEYHFSMHKLLYISLCIIFITGAICGGYFTNITSEDKLIEVKEQYNEFCKGEVNMTFWESYVNTLTPALKTLLIIFCSAFFSFTFPLAYTALFLKGFSIGFTLCFLKSCFGGCGLTLAVCSTLIQLIFFIPLFLIISVLTIKFCLSKREKRKTDKKELLFAFFIFLIFLAIISFPVAWISITYPKVICGIFL